MNVQKKVWASSPTLSLSIGGTSPSSQPIFIWRANPARPILGGPKRAGLARFATPS